MLRLCVQLDQGNGVRVLMRDLKIKVEYAIRGAVRTDDRDSADGERGDTERKDEALQCADSKFKRDINALKMFATRSLLLLLLLSALW